MTSPYLGQSSRGWWCPVSSPSRSRACRAAGPASPQTGPLCTAAAGRRRSGSSPGGRPRPGRASQTLWARFSPDSLDTLWRKPWRDKGLQQKGVCFSLDSLFGWKSNFFTFSFFHRHQRKVALLTTGFVFLRASKKLKKHGFAETKYPDALNYELLVLYICAIIY